MKYMQLKLWKQVMKKLNFVLDKNMKFYPKLITGILPKYTNSMKRIMVIDS